ncbi:MAG: RDD family protein [Gammaproteobacteria bacterium]|nr:RDD family protein [Gammaproteobacteria bacterium]MYF02740.1 RDD family protein [Gammaproteobacteria bacterium]MYI77581.1 RDD family protein [Gammaproteobacteria bacterium]
MTTTLPPPTITEDTDFESARGEQFTLKDVEKLQILDTKVVLESPEGAELEIRPAGFLARGIALVVDEGLKLLIYVLFLLLVALLSSFMGPAVEDLLSALTLIVFFTVAWFYGVIFEQLNDGKTPGKVVSSIKVTNAEGTPVGIMQSIIRNLFRTVDTLFLSMPGIMLIGLIPSLIPLGVPGLFFVLFSKNFRRLGDHLADTIVIYTTQPRVAPYRGVTSPTTLPITLALQDQKLLLAFQDRSSEFSDERKIELAEVLEPLHSQHSEEAVNVCLGYANSIRGAS